MGNQLCDTVVHEPQLQKMERLSLNVPPQINKEKLSLTEIESLKCSQVKQQSQFISLIFMGHLIKCRQENVSYHKSSSISSGVPVINGLAKVYKTETQNELLYQGQLRNSKFDGYGKFYQQNQIVYEGYFKDNLFDGWGITPQFRGQFREGLYDGYGIYMEYLPQNSSIVTFYYEGYFQKGLYSGSGVLIKDIRWPVTQIQKIHEGKGIFEFINKQIQHGMGIFRKFGPKQIYIGQFSNGFRHGSGRLFKENMEFSGQFSHNLYHGLGTIFNNTSQGVKVIQTVFKMGKQLNE